MGASLVAQPHVCWGTRTVLIVAAVCPAATQQHAQAITQPSETLNMTAQLATARPEYPPFIPAPAGATPVLVLVELIAQDSNALERHLTQASVIPTTRLASGIQYSWTVHDQNNPNRFVLIQQWNSVEQQQGYITWRAERGDLAQLRSLLAQDPVVTYLSPIDLTTLPAQATSA